MDPPSRSNHGSIIIAFFIACGLIAGGVYYANGAIIFATNSNHGALQSSAGRSVVKQRPEASLPRTAAKRPTPKKEDWPPVYQWFDASGEVHFGDPAAAYLSGASTRNKRAVTVKPNVVETVRAAPHRERIPGTVGGNQEGDLNSYAYLSAQQLPRDQYAENARICKSAEDRLDALRERRRSGYSVRDANLLDEDENHLEQLRHSHCD